MQDINSVPATCKRATKPWKNLMSLEYLNPMLLFALALAACSSGPRDHCVHDGDTVWLEGEKIRLQDIDTPELNGKCDYERRLAIRARDRLIVLLNAGPFKIRRNGTDHYGRTLAVIHRDGRSIGDHLVAEGLARTWSGRREPWC